MNQFIQTVGGIVITKDIDVRIHHYYQQQKKHPDNPTYARKIQKLIAKRNRIVLARQR